MSFAKNVLTTLETVTAALPDGGERREGQQKMAEVVADTIVVDGHTVITAGTGIGKSLAYLVPVALARKPTIIATATKALQDQLADKDLPFLINQLDDPPSFAVLKGRSNYLCLQRLDELGGEATLDLDLHDGPFSSQKIERLKDFAASSLANPTAIADRSELSDISDQEWRRISVGGDECPGAQHCPQGEDCFTERARRIAAEADIVIVNHHLYALSIMMETTLPDHDIAVIDEAHQFHDIVAEAAGRQISPARVSDASRAAASAVADSDKSDATEQAATELCVCLEPHLGQRLPDGPDELIIAALEKIRSAAENQLADLRSVPDSATPDTKAKAIRALQLLTSLIDDIDAARQPSNEVVVWVDSSTKNPALRSTPIDVAEVLSENHWEDHAAILTSATLPPTTPGQLGLPDKTTVIDVGSPFKYEAHALLYCPSNIPDPRQDGFREAQHVEIEALIGAAGGRTLALFTSYSAMNEAADTLKGRLPGPLLVQGNESKNALLEKFVGDEKTSLFATMSFWQGVDAPGSTCQLVIIDRLPFPRPDDPVGQARREHADPGGWWLVDLPRATTLLAQGAGRLIRTATDKGVVAVLDPRLATNKSYRWDFVNALPPMRRTRERSEAEKFLRQLRGRGG